MKERDCLHIKLARQVGGAIACLLALALLLGLTACGRGQAQQPQDPPPAAADDAPAAPDPEPEPEPDEDVPQWLEPVVPDDPPEEDEHDGFPEPEEDDGTHSTDPDFTQEELDQLVADVLDAIISEDMTSMEQARAVFDYTHNNIRYTGHADKEDWVSGAYVGLTTGKGDCFTYYAVSRALLDALGIDNLPVERVGGKTLHFWNLVNCGDGWYHFDACPRSLKLPSFLSFMVTDEQVAAFTAMAGRNYYDFDGSLLPERATERVTNTWPKPRPQEDEPEPDAADPNATDPDAADPGTADPGATDPGTADPGVTDPGVGEGTTEPPEPELPPDDPAGEPGAPAENLDEPAGDPGTDPESPDVSNEEQPTDVWTEPPAEAWPEPVPDGGDNSGETEAA